VRGLTRLLGEYLKDVGWALFLIDLFLGIIALLAGRYLEYETAAWVCLGLAVLVTLIIGSIIAGNLDGFVKSPSAALRCNFVVVAPKGPHSSIFARLASGAFYETIV
jgi:hypothetical protein